MTASRPPVRYGAANNRYNGGLSTTSDGRTVICCRDGSQVLYSRGLMAAHLGRLLSSDEIVHHLNEDPTDDRIANYKIVTRAEHIALHREALLAARTTFQSGDEHWSRRAPHRVARGERNGNAKLTDAQVAAIRAERAETGASGAAIARRFGVASNTVTAILRGETRT